MRKTNYIDPEQLRAQVHYDPLTGNFSRKLPGRRNNAGHVYTTRYPGEYRHVPLNGKSIRSGRAAWVWMTGEQPDIIDHINGIKHDDRWCNLRNVTESENQRNRVSHRKKNGTFVELEDCC